MCSLGSLECGFSFCGKPQQEEGERDWELKRERRDRDPGDCDIFLLWLMSGPFLFHGPTHARALSWNQFQMLLCSKMSLWSSCKVYGLLENSNLKMGLRCLETLIGTAIGMNNSSSFSPKIYSCAVEIPWLNGSPVSFWSSKCYHCFRWIFLSMGHIVSFQEKLKYS